SAMSARFAEGFERTVDVVASAINGAGSDADRRQRALAIVAAEIGAIAVARATAKARPELSDEVIVAARRILGEAGGEQRASVSKSPSKRRPEVRARKAARKG